MEIKFKNRACPSHIFTDKKGKEKQCKKNTDLTHLAVQALKRRKIKSPKK